MTDATPYTVAILFARPDSVYKTLPGCDVWDAERDALNWPGGPSLVAHPPCRAWGRLRMFAKPRPGEKELALWAVDQVRQWGGVLEHPASSLLWREKPLPKPGTGFDEFGGFTIAVLQKWWGHRADKATWLYICGCAPKDIPPAPINLHESQFIVSSSLHRKGDPKWRPHLQPAEREHSPGAFAEWLVIIARVIAAKRHHNPAEPEK